MLALTHQRICPLRTTCYYPNIKSQLFLRQGAPCNNGYRCSVESGLDAEHLIAMIEDADRAERNTARLLLPWYCGCRRCQLGYSELCYARKGPDRALREIFQERWRLQQIQDARRNMRDTPLSRLRAQKALKLKMTQISRLLAQKARGFIATQHHRTLQPDPRADARAPLRHLPLFPDDQGQENVAVPAQ